VLDEVDEMVYHSKESLDEIIAELPKDKTCCSLQPCREQ
jgi:hypothetical protein